MTLAVTALPFLLIASVLPSGPGGDASVALFSSSYLAAAKVACRDVAVSLGRQAASRPCIAFTMVVFAGGTAYGQRMMGSKASFLRGCAAAWVIATLLLCLVADGIVLSAAAAPKVWDTLYVMELFGLVWRISMFFALILIVFDPLK